MPEFRIFTRDRTYRGTLQAQDAMHAIDEARRQFGLPRGWDLFPLLADQHLDDDPKPDMLHEERCRARLWSR